MLEIKLNAKNIIYALLFCFLVCLTILFFKQSSDIKHLKSKLTIQETTQYVLIDKIDDLDDQISDLDSKYSDLEEKISDLEYRIEELE